MAMRKPALIALFNVDGTLTTPRKVLIFFSVFYFYFFPLDCLVEYLSREWLFCKNCLHNINIAYTLYFVFDAMLSSQLLVGHSRNLRIHEGTLKGI